MSGAAKKPRCEMLCNKGGGSLSQSCSLAVSDALGNHAPAQQNGEEPARRALQHNRLLPTRLFSVLSRAPCSQGLPAWLAGWARPTSFLAGSEAGFGLSCPVGWGTSSCPRTRPCQESRSPKPYEPLPHSSTAVKR